MQWDITFIITFITETFIHKGLYLHIETILSLGRLELIITKNL